MSAILIYKASGRHTPIVGDAEPITIDGMAISLVFSEKYSTTSLIPKPKAIKGEKNISTLNTTEKEWLKGGSYSLKSITNKAGENVELTYSGTLPTGEYIIVYECNYNSGLTIGGRTVIDGTLTYSFLVENQNFPFKKYSISDTIVRICDTIIPLKYGQKPKFRLQGVIYDNETGNATGYEQGSLAEKLDKIIAPEYAFTKMTLREMLQQVGGTIHGEPRVLDIKYDEDGTEWFEVGFDMYGSSKVSNISKRHRVSAGFGTDINEYCTSLDSSADNLISQLDWAQGVVTEPFNHYGCGRSLRTETTTTRMAEDDSTFIKTELPIYALGEKKQVFCTNIPGIDKVSGTITEVSGDLRLYLSYNETDYPNFVYLTKWSDDDVFIAQQAEDGRWYVIKPTNYRAEVGDSVKAYFKYDITPYIFEKADYDNLSSYKGVYPFAKNFALYYTQGQPNIKGLFFKVPNAVTGVWSKYAIINILRQVTGNNALDVSGQDLMKLAFEVTYLPQFSTRIKTNKQTVIGGLPRTMAYNQSANLIESRAYGENLKGVVARLGNVSKTYTYHLAFLSDIPKAGMMFDKHYYISSVSCEYLPSYIKCTISLSKDFNRLSQYIGINSNKRMWEVSEKQSFERESIFVEYVKITQNSEDLHDVDSLYLYNTGVASYLFNKAYSGLITSAYFRRYLLNESELTPEISLPVISTAIGNSMLFTYRVEDNYSAGQKSSYVDNDAYKVGVSGYWGEYVPYNDYYGRFYYLGFRLDSNPTPRGNGISLARETSLMLPQVEMLGNYYISTRDETLIKYRKDSREVPSITYQLTAVTDDDSIIIGSALMKNCKMVNSKPVKKYQVYAFTEYLNNLDSYLDTTYEDEVINIDNGVLIADGIGDNGFIVNGDSITLPDIDTKYKAWAIVTEATIETIDVQDEMGIQTVQKIQKGGELVLGQNKIPENKTFYFRVKTNVYDI